MGARGRPVLVYDGDCGFCSASVRWISPHWRADVDAEAWQALGAEGLAALGLSQEACAQAAYWVDSDGRAWRGHLAVAKALSAADGWRRAAGRLGLVPPGRWVGAAVYPLVVRWRHRLPGASQSCRVAPGTGRG